MLRNSPLTPVRSSDNYDHDVFNGNPITSKIFNYSTLVIIALRLDTFVLSVG